MALLLASCSGGKALCSCKSLHAGAHVLHVMLASWAARMCCLPWGPVATPPILVPQLRLVASRITGDFSILDFCEVARMIWHSISALVTFRSLAPASVTTPGGNHIQTWYCTVSGIILKTCTRQVHNTKTSLPCPAGHRSDDCCKMPKCHKWDKGVTVL